MDMQMYNLVKAAINEGKPLESVINEVKIMGETAQKELAPQTPIADKWGRRANSYFIDTTSSGLVNKHSLVGVMMAYFVQHGFAPDSCFDTEDEFRDAITGILDRGLDSSKAAANIAQMEKNGATDAEMLDAMFSAIGKMARDAFDG